MNVHSFDLLMIDVLKHYDSFTWAREGNVAHLLETSFMPRRQIDTGVYLQLDDCTITLHGCVNETGVPDICVFSTPEEADLKFRTYSGIATV
jgi:hypothetical protein